MHSMSQIFKQHNNERYNIRILQHHHTYIKPRIWTSNYNALHQSHSPLLAVAFLCMHSGKKIHLGLDIQLNYLGVVFAT